MDEASTPPKKTSTATGGTKTKPQDSATAKQLFIAAALSMSWQLAVVVVVPIVGGYELDLHLGSAPVWELIGFVVALLGFFGVVHRAVSDLNQLADPKKRGRK
jgi:F0F1-type ATP synthase assembly protein I